MTDRELHRLGRRELLQMMLESGREAEKYKKQLKDTEEQMARLEENYERLRKRLDQKDTQIYDLKEALQAEQKRWEIELEEAGSIAEAALRINGIFDAAQKAAEQYIYNIRRLHDLKIKGMKEIEEIEEIKEIEESPGREAQDIESGAQSAEQDGKKDIIDE